MADIRVEWFACFDGIVLWSVSRRGKIIWTGFRESCFDYAKILVDQLQSNGGMRERISKNRQRKLSSHPKLYEPVFFGSDDRPSK